MTPAREEDVVGEMRVGQNQFILLSFILPGGTFVYVYKSLCECTVPTTVLSCTLDQV